MARRNRVTPFGDIVAVEARGTLFGNRGIIHDDRGEIVRAWQVRRWLACRLEFRGRHHEVMRPGRYTGLFFLDEPTALAAGHRPCAECRHADFLLFREAWTRAHSGQRPTADQIDRALHAERLDEHGGKRVHRARGTSLPDGAMVAIEGEAWLVLRGELLRWTPSGYAERRPGRDSKTVSVLTPPSTVAVLRAGYSPELHPSTTPA